MSPGDTSLALPGSVADPMEASTRDVSTDSWMRHGGIPSLGSNLTPAPGPRRREAAGRTFRKGTSWRIRERPTEQGTGTVGADRHHAPDPRPRRGVLGYSSSDDVEQVGDEAVLEGSPDTAPPAPALAPFTYLKFPPPYRDSDSRLLHDVYEVLVSLFEEVPGRYKVRQVAWQGLARPERWSTAGLDGPSGDVPEYGMASLGIVGRLRGFLSWCLPPWG